VGEVLPDFGFSAAQIATVQGMIMAAQLPQSPHTVLEQILADADLDVLGRDDFATRNQDLHAELTESGTVLSDERWYSIRLETLQRHPYWAEAARSLRDEGKQKNIELLQRLQHQRQAGQGQDE
jgi:uncharacterized protein